MNVQEILLTVASIFFGFAVMGALVVLFWAVGCGEKIKTRFNWNVSSQIPDTSNGIGVKSTSSEETEHDLENGAPGKGSYDMTPVDSKEMENGAPGKGSYDMTPVDSKEMESLSPRSKMSDTIDFADASTKATSFKTEGKNNIAGAPFPFLCVTKRTYPQVKTAATRGAFVALEEDT